MSVPFVVSSKASEKLLTSVQKVFKAAGSTVNLTKTDVFGCPQNSHILSGPLGKADTAELANKFGLTTKITNSIASKWYPDSPYSGLTTVSFRNLYGDVNPAFQTILAKPTSSQLVVKDDSITPLLEIRKESDRAISSFFQNEARESLHDTLRSAFNWALANKKADRQVVSVVHKPLGPSTSLFDEFIVQLAKSESDARGEEFRSNNVALELQPVGIAWPKLAVFPESLAILVLTSTEHGEQLEQLLVGLAGGRGLAAQKLVSGVKGSPTLFTSDSSANPTGLLVSAADLLNALGQKQQSEAIIKALEKTYQSKVIPSELPNGTADVDTFVDAVCKNF